MEIFVVAFAAALMGMYVERRCARSRARNEKAELLREFKSDMKKLTDPEER